MAAPVSLPQGGQGGRASVRFRPAGDRTGTELVAPREFPAWTLRLGWGLALCALLAASRWLPAPRYLITFDEINFALAIRDFNPALHQPQPPGDPLFVALLKLLAMAIPRVELVFMAAALLLSLAALAALWAFGDEVLGRREGVLAPLLLLFNPPFWLAALTNPVRLALAAGASGVAVCLFLGIRRNSTRWFFTACGMWGVAAGFRPGLAVTLAPLVLFTAIRMRLRWRPLLAGAAITLLGVACWLPALLAASGGIRAFADMLRGYSADQMGATSIFLGARLGAAAAMAWQGVVWACLGTLSWIWVLVLPKREAAMSRELLLFLLVWFLPGMLFQATFHVADPDHTLSIVPATCVAGALVLSAAARNRGARTRLLLFTAVLVLNAFLFLKPISKTAKASTYKPVAWLDGYIARVLDTLRDLQRVGGVTAVFYEPVTGWRQASYYLPGVDVLVIREPRGAHPAGWEFQRGQERNWNATGAPVELPGCGMWAWIDPVVQPSGGAMARRDPIWYRPAEPGAQVEFHGLRFVGGPCIGK